MAYNIDDAIFHGNMIKVSTKVFDNEILLTDHCGHNIYMNVYKEC